MELKINQLKKKLINPEFLAMSFKTLNNPDFYTLIEALSTQPFMFGNTVLVINCEKYLLSDSEKTTFSDSELEKLSEALSCLPETLHVIFCCKIPRSESKKVDSRKKIYKLLAKTAVVEEFAQFRTYDKLLAEWIKKCAKEKEISLGANSVQVLIDTVGANLRNIDCELEKLKLYKYPKKEITMQDVKHLCNQTEDVFKLLDFYIEGRKDLAAEEFKKLNQKQNCLITLASLQTSLRRAAAIKIDSRSMSAAAIGQKLKLHEYVVKLQLEKLNKITFDDLTTLKNNLAKAEYQIKSGDIAPPETAIEMALLC